MNIELHTFKETTDEMRKEAEVTGFGEQMDDLLWACEDLQEVQPEFEDLLRNILTPVRGAISIVIERKDDKISRGYAKKTLDTANKRINQLLTNLIP